MPLITVKAATIPPGVYRADLIGIAPKRMVTQYSKNGEEQDFLEWTWLVHGTEREIEINSLTTVATGPKSRIFEYLVALLGADKVVIDAGFEESDLVGKSVQVQLVTDDNGYAKIDRIMAVQKEAGPKTQPGTPTVSPKREDPAPMAPVQATVAAEADAAIATADLDDLPF